MKYVHFIHACGWKQNHFCKMEPWMENKTQNMQVA